jgi:hypothetical protein
MFDPVLIQMVRKITPTLMAEHLVGVQPLQDDLFKNVLRMSIVQDTQIPKQGSLIHSFIYGWQRFYGTEFISEDLWIQLKIKGL